MLKFRRLIIKSATLQNFIALQNLCFIGTTPVTLAKSSRKSSKFKNFHKSKKVKSALMDSKSAPAAVNSKSAPADLHRGVAYPGRNSSANSVPPQLSSSKTLSMNRKYPGYRQWEDTELGSEIKGLANYTEGGRSFTVMSYNILAQDLLELHPYLYTYHVRTALNWEYRLSRLRDEILLLQPDILCLQEVQNNHIDAILDSLRDLNFGCVFKKKTGSRTDGCAILFNKDLFSLLNQHSVEYFQPGIERLNRDNVAIIVQLSLKSNPSARFIVSTTHLLYNPRRQDVRLAQIQVLLAELDRVSINGFWANGEPRRLPVILTGDFNLKPHSAPYNLLNTGSLYYYNLTVLQLEEASDENVHLIGKEFLPPKLGITDHCQHIDLITSNYQGKSRLKHTEANDHVRDESISESFSSEQLNFFSTGKISHGLNFTSVYTHAKPNGEKEATTFQERWVTVDYIFYSNCFTPKANGISDGYLKLLSRYTLPTVDQCHAMAMIPNSELGSDHLSLAAKFFLQAPRNG